MAEIRIEESWKRVLADEWEKDYFTRLTSWVREQYRQGPVFPPGSRIFAAFDATPFERVKVVILGQDPYHDVGQASPPVHRPRPCQSSRHAPPYS